MSIPTPHINAKSGDFAPTVIMPGDPLRSKFIAETFLTSPVLVNNVRGVQGYTGFYKGMPVSGMAHGMGMPSMGIYAHELYNFYQVKNIIRVGSCGAIASSLRLRDVVIAQAACTNSNFSAMYTNALTLAPIGDYSLIKCAESAANNLNIPVHVGNVMSNDCFYDETTHMPMLRNMGVLAVEMEVAALYFVAMRAGKRALGILTVSDLPLSIPHETLPALDREQSFTDMMKIALETAVSA